jgi:hypothetical protein
LCFFEWSVLPFPGPKVFWEMSWSGAGERTLHYL